jgi:hypothetical protein
MRLDLHQAFRELRLSVEVGAHPLLTDAVVMLTDAEAKLREYYTEIKHPLVKNDGDVKMLCGLLGRALVAGNHLSNWKTANWPLYGTPHDQARNEINDAKEYDIWCCWNELMLISKKLRESGHD